MTKRRKLYIAGTLLIVPLLLVVALLVFQGTSRASVNPNDVIDDVVFENTNTMNAGQIDSFLNSFPGSCISTNNGFSTPDPTGWSSSVGSNHGYTFGGNVSAGQAIYDTARIYHVNPEVILATMQKEQSIVTGSGSASSFCHYNNQAPGSACDAGVYHTVGGCVFIGMSYACPGNCDFSYNGFSLQLIASTWLFRFAEERAQGQTSGYAGYDPGDSSVGYGGAMVGVPYQLIDGNVVTVQSGGTAALYYYTPTESGGQSFASIFQSWFGPTTLGDSYYAVVCDPTVANNPGWYLLTATGKYPISGAAYAAWGLANYYPEPGCGNAANTVSTAFFNSLPTGPTLGNMLKDQWGNYFWIDNGEIHYIPSANYFAVWGLNPATAVQSTGLAYAMAGGNWTGRFMTDPVSGNGQIWLMDGGEKYLIPSNNSMLYQWGYTASALTQVSTTYLNALTNEGTLTQFVSSGSSNFAVDSGRVLYFGNSDTQSAYNAQTPSSLNSIWTLSTLPLQQANVFVEDSSTGAWYMLEGGNRHYIPNLLLAEDWGYSPGQQLTMVSDPLIQSFTNGGTLSYMVQTASPSQAWAVDGSKHYMAAGAVENAWVPSGNTLPTYSSQSLDLLPRGSDLTTLIQPQGASFVYALDNGNKRYLPLPIIANAWGYPSISQVTGLSSNLVNLIPETASISVNVQNSGNYYLLMNGTAYQVNASVATTWGLGSSSPQIANSTLARFAAGPEINTTFFQVGGTYYIMNDLHAIPVVNHLDAYGLNNSNTVSLPYNYFATDSDASYLVKSTNTSDSSMWLITGGQKYLFGSFAQEANYGYVSDGAAVTALDPEVLSQIPTGTGSPSLLINTTNQGVKLLSFGYALGFPDGSTLNNYISTTNPIMTVSPSVYNEFGLRRTTSKVIQDDSHNDYVMVSGQKDMIQNPALLTTTYAGIPITYLEGTTMVSIPSGSPLN